MGLLNRDSLSFTGKTVKCLYYAKETIMCGITGLIFLGGINSSSVPRGVMNVFQDYFESITQSIASRGPDAYGITSLSSLKDSTLSNIVPVVLKKHQIIKGNASSKEFNYIMLDECKNISNLAFSKKGNRYGFLVNFRGIPTTETLGNALLNGNEIQPFTYNNTTVVHNGLINNDDDVYEHFGVEYDPEKYIDTYSIAVAIESAINYENKRN